MATDVRMDILVISGKVYQSTTGLTLNPCIRAIIRVLHGYFGYQWLCCQLLVNNTELRARQGFGHGCTDGYFSYQWQGVSVYDWTNS
ncbi:MAG: hypothetical protein F6K54_23325 [Okeania sp. SIO3B5]|uniref:hypothetical protein n=1 Tax=Okeania sp. SIO3B5 TaxID=2607811 RepID=UPI0013FE736C|nr:hypothetical protein [Okeania sp. SIO3B5]NEO55741.1 hypothetical protein [Okeania sp. SIO3B5]